jgi:hypothetical protein
MTILPINGDPDCFDLRQQTIAIQGYLRHNRTVETLPGISVQALFQPTSSAFISDHP